jgi:hypothetical protein
LWDAVCGILSPILGLYGLILAITTLCKGFEPDVLPDNLFSLLGAIILLVVFGGNTYYNFRRYYSWAEFDKFGVSLCAPFAKKQTISYANCESFGIAPIKTPFGTKYYIYLSRKAIASEDLTNILAWKQSVNRLKVPHNEALYELLVGSIPRKKVSILQRDHTKCFNKK